MPAILAPGIIRIFSDRKLKNCKNNAIILCFPEAYSSAIHSDCRSLHMYHRSFEFQI